MSEPGRQRVLAGSEDGKVYVYGLNDREVVQKVNAHEDVALALDASKAREFFATGGMEKDPCVRFFAPADEE